VKDTRICPLCLKSFSDCDCEDIVSIFYDGEEIFRFTLCEYDTSLKVLNSIFDNFKKMGGINENNNQ